MRTLAVGLAIVVAGCGGREPAEPAPAPPSPPTPAPKVVDEGDGAAFVAQAKQELVGRRAPAITLELLDGSRVELATVLGKRPVYLKFWATWCVPCREQMPHLEDTFKKHGDRLAVYAVDVGLDDPIETVRQFVATKKLAVPVAYDRDGNAAHQFHLHVTPQHVLIDSAGIVRFVGHAVTPALEQAIAEVLEPAKDVEDAPAVTTLPMPPLQLDDKSLIELAAPRTGPLVLTFGALFCDSYIVDSRPEIGASCAAHVKAAETLHQAHPGLRWITVAYPVWTSADDIAGFRKRLASTLPIGIDRGNAWFRHFAVRNPFTTIAIDPAGKELGRVEGDGAGLAALIDKLK